MRCAIYARYSTEMQHERSIADQIRQCKQYAAQFTDFEIVERYVCFDEAISGTSLRNRGGLQSLIDAAKCKNQPFDVVLIDDTSRLARNTEDALHLVSIFEFNNVAVVSVTQGLDTRNKSSRLLLTLHAMIDEQYVVGISDKVHRGQEGRVLEGLIVGGRCFGYRNIPIEHSSKKGKYGRPVVNGVRAEVNQEEATVVRRIFQMCADGFTLSEIVAALNRDQEISPFKLTRHNHRWIKSCVREILYNERYRGVQVWNRTRKQRNPETGRKVSRPRQESEWKRVEVPEWRIVSEQLWISAHTSLALRKTNFGSRSRSGVLRSSSSEYLFSGFLKCGLCSGNLTITSGGGSKRFKRYGCPSYRFHGTCSNNLTIRVDSLEQQLLGQLRTNGFDHLDRARVHDPTSAGKAVLAQYCGPFVLSPSSRNERKCFKVVGSWKMPFSSPARMNPPLEFTIDC